MTLYSYRCRGCKAPSDLIRRPENRDNPAYCTTCQAWSSRRIMTAPGLIGETVVRDQVVGPGQRNHSLSDGCVPSHEPEPMSCGCRWTTRIDSEQAETFARIEAEEVADASTE